MRRHLTESKFQGWRALARRSNGEEHLIYLGPSYEQVKKNYEEAFDILTEDEQSDVVAIDMQRWAGIADRGQWTTQDNLRIPAIVKASFTEKVPA